MLANLNDNDLRELSDALSCRYVTDVCGGAVRLISATLPGKAVCAAVSIAGVLCVVIDIDKPYAIRHAQQMMNQWRAEYVVPVMTDSGQVELVPMGTPRRCETDPPVGLTLVS